MAELEKYAVCGNNNRFGGDDAAGISGSLILKFEWHLYFSKSVRVERRVRKQIDFWQSHSTIQGKLHQAEEVNQASAPPRAINSCRTESVLEQVDERETLLVHRRTIPELVNAVAMSIASAGTIVAENMCVRRQQQELLCAL